MTSTNKWLTLIVTAADAAAEEIKFLFEILIVWEFIAYC